MLCSGMKEIEKPSAQIVKLRRTGKRIFLDDKDDVYQLRTSLLELANRIEALKAKTPWPEWSQCQADSMRDYANNLNQN